MKQVRVKADDSQTITAIYEFLHDLDNEYSNFRITARESSAIQLPSSSQDFDEACEALDSCGVKFELDGGDRIMVEDELRQDALSVFDKYDIDAEEV